MGFYFYLRSFSRLNTTFKGPVKKKLTEYTQANNSQKYVVRYAETDPERFSHQNLTFLWNRLTSATNSNITCLFCYILCALMRDCHIREDRQEHHQEEKETKKYKSNRKQGTYKHKLNSLWKELQVLASLKPCRKDTTEVVSASGSSSCCHLCELHSVYPQKWPVK